MKRILLFIAIVAMFVANGLAGSPKWMKTAGKSMLTLNVVQQGGDTLRANAFFLNATGSVVAPFKAIQQARKAWVTDATGKEFEVCRILGFNSTYNVVLLQTIVDKKKTLALPTLTDSLSKGTIVMTMPLGEQDEIVQVERAGEYGYYTLKSAVSKEREGMPVVDAQGRLVAVMQSPIVADNAPNYALDIRMPMALTIRPIDANNADLRSCSILKQLPSDEAQATTFLYLLTSTSPENRITYADEFIKLFPQSSTGYTQKADALIAERRMDAAEETLAKAMNECGKKDEILYARSRAIYNGVLQADSLPEGWTLDEALSDIAKAYEINALPLYLLHEAHVLYAAKRFDEACVKFLACNQTDMRSAELFIYAWQCRKAAGIVGDSLLALNDSAVACFTKPYPTAAAPYLYLRANTLVENKRIREAINDLNDYEHLMHGQLTAEFYYQREQLESQVRMLGPAVNDIQRAITLAPNEPYFHAEMATLLLRLNDMDGAINSCKKAIELNDSLADAYRIWGICLREKGDLTGARKQLIHAQELGDTLAGGILENMR